MQQLKSPLQQKNFLKKLPKYSQVRSCYEDLIAMHTMVYLDCRLGK